jgi:hypothetical protein
MNPTETMFGVDWPNPGSVTALRAFLDGLRDRLRHPPRPTPLPNHVSEEIREVAATDDLPQRFALAARSAGCQVDILLTEDVAPAVRRIAAGQNATTAHVVIDDTAAGLHGGPTTSDLLACLRAPAVDFAEAGAAQALFNADMIVTDVAAAIAETGSLVCWTRNQPRGASLYPPLHVAIVHEPQIVPDLADFFAALDPAAIMPSHICLVTGPSKTADIEGVLVTGVHGPGRVHILVVRAT